MPVASSAPPRAVTQAKNLADRGHAAPMEAPKASKAPARPAKAAKPAAGKTVDRSMLLDHSGSTVLQDREAELFERIAKRLDAPRLELPYLATTSVALIDMASKANADVEDMVRLISTDPTLSSELLKTANSVVYATSHPAETIHEATMRIGLRALRSLIFSASMRTAVFRGDGMTEYAEEVWRQAHSVATIARVLAPSAAIDAEKAFLLGLLHDVGKVALLSVLRKEVGRQGSVTSALVGKVFMRYHERAGRQMAEQWKLSDEFISVAGCHHDYRANEDFPRSAALVSLAHRLDLFFCIGEGYENESLTDCDELEFLGVPSEQRYGLLLVAREAFLANEQQNAGGGTAQDQAA